MNNMKYEARHESHCKYSKWKENKFNDIIGYKLKMMNLIQVITKPLSWKPIRRWIHSKFQKIHQPRTSALNTDGDELGLTNFSTDSIEFAIDNSTNVRTCNQKETFTSLSPLDYDPSIIIAGDKAMPEGIGTVSIL